MGRGGLEKGRRRGPADRLVVFVRVGISTKHFFKQKTSELLNVKYCLTSSSCFKTYDNKLSSSVTD